MVFSAHDARWTLLHPVPARTETPSLCGDTAPAPREMDFAGKAELVSSFEPLSPCPWPCEGAACPHLRFLSSAELPVCSSPCHQADGSHGGLSPCPTLSRHVVSGIPSPASLHTSSGWLWANWAGKHPEVSGFFQGFPGVARILLLNQGFGLGAQRTWKIFLKRIPLKVFAIFCWAGCVVGLVAHVPARMFPGTSWT